MLSIEPRSHHRSDEELGSVGVGAGIGHGQEAGFSVQRLEVLVWEEGVRLIAGRSGALRVPTGKFLAVDGLSTSTVVAGEVTTLKHELGDHTVEGGTFIAEAVLASRKLSEVLRSPGDGLVVQLENDSTSGSTVADSDVKLEGVRR
jgi:hypothetical protein